MNLSSQLQDFSRGARIGIGIAIGIVSILTIASYAGAPWGALPTVSSGSTVNSSQWNDLVAQSNTLANTSGLRIKKAYTPLVTAITYHTITPTNTYTIPVTLPSDTKGVIIGLKYTHNGQADHGYLSFNAYQQGATSADDKAFFPNYHYNDYFNTDYHEEIVPWNNTGSGNAITIQVTESYNSNTANTYDIIYAGYIADR